MKLGSIGKQLGAVGALVNQPYSPVAIDFGSGALKVLQVTGGEPPALVAAAGLETPLELISDPVKRIEFQIQALPTLIKACGFKGKRAVCAIPAVSTVCRQLQVPRGDPSSIAASVRSLLSAQMTCDPSALVFRHVAVGESGRAGAANKVEVIALSVHRDLVDRLMKGIKAAKLEPVGMHGEFTAIIHAFQYITRREGDADLTTLYLDMGAGSTKAVIAHGLRPVFAKTIDVGGAAFDETIMRQTKCVLTDARKQRLAMKELVHAAPGPAQVESGGLALLAAGERQERAAAPAGEDRRRGALAPGLTERLDSDREFTPPSGDLSEPLEILTDEIGMCLRHHGSMFPDRPVDRAIFVGGESRIVGLCQLIAKRLGLPAQVGDPMTRVARTGKEPSPGVDLRAPQPGWTTVLGLCQCPTDL